MMKRRGKKSILEPVSSDVIKMYETDTLLEIQLWLKAEKNIKITTAGLHKYIKGRLVAKNNSATSSLHELEVSSGEKIEAVKSDTVNQEKNTQRNGQKVISGNSVFSSIADKKKFFHDNNPDLDQLLKEFDNDE